MWSTIAITASAAGLLLAIPASAEGLYSKNSPVVQVTAQNYGRLIAKSNHTSIVEFYAPWCGHCKNLKPAYEKAAKKLQGLAKVASVNCDDDANKPFCGEMGVKGFPTLKIIRPSKKSGKPTVEEYQGARSAKAIVDAVVEKIPNHVKRVTDKSIDSWLAQDNETAKAILFTEKGTTSALLRALAIDYLGSINFGQVRNKESAAVETFGISKYPSFVLLPGGEKDAVVYDGELKKEGMAEFLKQVAQPNPDPAPAASKKDKAKASMKTSAAKDKSEKDTPPSEGKPLIPAINDEATLRERCLLPTSKICALVLLPNINPSKESIPDGFIESLRSLAEVYDKHAKRRSAFAFYLVEPSLELVKTLRKELGLGNEKQMELVAVNAKKLWFKKYTASDFKQTSVETWVDAIRMNEGKKEALPESLVAQETRKADDTEEKAQEKPSNDKKSGDEKESQSKDEHDEL
ncbi:thioredoxin-domain-containing protein [Microthyrium microscopicum]|uniref:protein disulfide-isomerase n=1 Tax=Microthyrium microscopicum TaxID=703497 RepID=A0A6A6UUN5_9PEZI|nr:thioredoxin-domain-containing protein [Microthyrium microscopicum]